MKAIIKPTEPTPWAKWLGIEKLGDFDRDNKTYVLEVIPCPAALNFFGTIHGGYLAGVFDDAFGMLAYFIYGVNAATTAGANVIPLKMIRPSQQKKLVFIVSLKEEKDGLLMLIGSVKSGESVFAKAESVWQLRKNRGEE
jgi:acyl-coenzyme A thioesterase PaaI-like protein